MSLADPMPSRPLEPDILNPFTGSYASRRRRFFRMLVGPSLLIFCFLYGFFFALWGQFLAIFFAIPIALLLALSIWALPQLARAPTRSLVFLFYVFSFVLIVWPNYLAISLPGLPWITFVRLVNFPMVVIFLICISVSAEFRSTQAEILKAVPIIWKLLVAFSVIQLISIGLSKTIVSSAQKFLVAQTSWTAVFFISLYVFRKPGRVERWAAMFWITSLIIGAIGIQEHRKSAVPWAGHVPSFLKIEDPIIQKILLGAHRAMGSFDMYRVQSTFSTSLGLGEFVALVMPFVMYFFVAPYRPIVRLAAFLTMPFLMYIVVLSDSRLGSVGCLLTFVLYPLFLGILRWRRDKGGLLGPAITLAYPAIFAAGIGATLFIGKLRVKVWGGHAHDASNAARVAQYSEGIPMVLKHPLGFGIGRAAETLGYMNAGDELTIDTYYLMIAMDYGIIGFLVYYGILAFGVKYAGEYALKPRTGHKEFTFLIPLAIAQLNFFIIKSVFSNQENHPLIFIFLGATVALIYQMKMADKKIVALSMPSAQSTSQSGLPRRPRKPAHQPVRA